MKKTIFIVSLLLIASLGVTQAQNVFKKYGFKKEVLTLSKGKYQEIFKNEEVVQVGTVLVNTKTNKVVKFLNEDTTKTAYNAELSSRFLTIDPLCEKHPEISPYVFCNNNPVINIDPDGQDWYRSEEGNFVWRKSHDDSYTDKNGVKYTNIGEQYINISGTTITIFQQKTNEKGEMYLTNIVYDAKTEKMTDKALGVLMLQNSDASRMAAMKYWTDPSMKNWIKFAATETGSQYTNPYLIVGGASILTSGLSSLSSINSKVQFGNTSNQIYHTFRHTDALKLNRNVITTTIQNDLSTISSNVVSGKAINRVVTVNGVKLQYTAYKLSNGTINIGRIHAIQ